MTVSRPHIAIIGAGQLGSRHLQGLSNINQDVIITVVDPISDALELAQKRFKEMPLNSCVRSVNYHQDIPWLDGEVDLAILATNADLRRNVIEELVNNSRVKYLILEKVVFQSVDDFKEVMLLFEEREIKAWVNCPRRIYPFFRKLWKETIEADLLKISVKGSSWGLASNTIHMLDLLAFLSGQIEINIDFRDLDDKVYEAKKKGFIELGGRLWAETDRGDVLELIDDRQKDIPSQLNIEFNESSFEIDQQQGLVRACSHDGNKYDERSFHMPLQSDLTAGVAEEILKTGSSSLTPLDESYLLHCPMLDAFNTHLSSVLNKQVIICPIT